MSINIDLPRYNYIIMTEQCIITKLPESGDLCGNITELGVAEGSPEPHRAKMIHRRPK